MKPAIIGLAALALTATAASAASYGPKHNDGYRSRHQPTYEHVLVKRSKAHLAWVKRQAWADGRLSFRERLKIRRAERQLARAIWQARHFR
ncbi:MAG: hypothetical protein R3D57_18065 [Hyphomicrobiaceae bacterium]